MVRRVKTKLKKKLTKQETIAQVNFTLHGVRNNLQGQSEKLEPHLSRAAAEIAKAANCVNDAIIILSVDKLK